MMQCMITVNFSMCYQSSFRMLGDEWTVKPEVMTAFKSQLKEKYINAVHGKLLRHMVGDNEVLTMRSKVDLSKLPPCKDNLVPHIHRVNHRIAHFKQADQTQFLAPQANRSGTRMVEDQKWIRTNMVLQTYSPPFPD